jgi:hypothetical protein
MSFQPQTWPQRPQDAPQRPLPTITPSYVQIWAPRGACPSTAVCLERSYWPWMCHYWRSRTRPCTIDRGHCDACASGQRPRLTAWIAAVLRASTSRVILQLTAGALAGCPDLIRDCGQLYGRTLLVSRRHNGPQAPMLCQMMASLPLPQMPAPLDTLRILSAVWNMPTDVLRQLVCVDLSAGVDSAVDQGYSGQS